MERSSDVLISNDPELVKSAAVDIPVKEINKLLEQYINFKGFTPTTLFDPTDNELIDEMQHENLWNAMENIEYSEKVYSGWIDAIKTYRQTGTGIIGISSKSRKPTGVPNLPCQKYKYTTNNHRPGSCVEIMQ